MGDMGLRKPNGLLKDCTLGALKRPSRCRADQCSKCGWNPRIIELRKKYGRFHKHESGLWGF